jgi:hypothetical protein
MLAQREHVEPDLFGLRRDPQDRLDPLGLARRAAGGRLDGDLTDREDPELQGARIYCTFN